MTVGDVSRLHSQICYEEASFHSRPSRRRCSGIDAGDRARARVMPVTLPTGIVARQGSGYNRVAPHYSRQVDVRGNNGHGSAGHQVDRCNLGRVGLKWLLIDRHPRHAYLSSPRPNRRSEIVLNHLALRPLIGGETRCAVAVMHHTTTCAVLSGSIRRDYACVG